MKGEGLELLWRMLMAGCAGPWQFAEKWCHCLWVLVSERGELVGSHISKVTTHRLCSPTSAPPSLPGSGLCYSNLEGWTKRKCSNLLPPSCLPSNSPLSFIFVFFFPSPPLTSRLLKLTCTDFIDNVWKKRAKSMSISGNKSERIKFNSTKEGEKNKWF